MDKIMAITLPKMHNSAHIAFMSHVKDLLTTENIPTEAFEKQIETFNMALQTEEATAQVRRKSFLTDELVTLNAQREELYAGMVHHYESCLRHYDDAVRTAAHGISHIMKSIAFMHNQSNINRNVSIWKITSNIRQPKYAPQVETMQLSGWLDALDTLNNKYQRTCDKRISEKARAGNGNVRKTRAVTDKAYQDIIRLVNALIVVNGPENYSLFMRRMNLHIAKVKKSMAISEGWRKHMKEKKKKEVV
jgi:hypothetical protein